MVGVIFVIFSGLLRYEDEDDLGCGEVIFQRGGGLKA